MRSTWFCGALGAAALSVTAPMALPAASAPTTYKVGAITIEAPWSRATPGGAQVAGGYMRIFNGGSEPDRLIGGTTLLSERFQVHEMSMADNVMRMRPLDNGLEIKPGETVELKPGGFHVMFLDLKAPFREGERVKGTLVFDKAGAVEIEYPIRSIAARSGEAGHAH